MCWSRNGSWIGIFLNQTYKKGSTNNTYISLCFVRCRLFFHFIKINHVWSWVTFAYVVVGTSTWNYGFVVVFKTPTLSYRGSNKSRPSPVILFEKGVYLGKIVRNLFRNRKKILQTRKHKRVSYLNVFRKKEGSKMSLKMQIYYKKFFEPKIFSTEGSGRVWKGNRPSSYFLSNDQNPSSRVSWSKKCLENT